MKRPADEDWIAPFRDTVPSCAIEACSLCAKIPELTSVDTYSGGEIPAWVARLVSLYGNGRTELKGCDECGTLYAYTLIQEYLDGLHCEDTGIEVKRVTGDQAAQIFESWDRDQEWSERRKKWGKPPALPRLVKGAGVRDYETERALAKATAEAEAVAEKQRAERARKEELRARATAGDLPPGFAGAAAELVDDPEHASWARAFLERVVLDQTAHEGDRATSIETLIRVAGGATPGADGWTRLSVADEPRLGKPGVAGKPLYFQRKQLPCGNCEKTDARTLFTEEISYRDPFYDYRNGIVEIECTSCRRYSVYIYHDESRS
jgi:hypothetical protein